MLRKMFSLWLARFAVLAVAVGFLLRDRLPFGAMVVVTLLIALLLNIAISVVLSGMRGRRDAKLLDRALRGELPRDGERIALAGTLRLDGEPLIAPFSGVECGMYSYNVSHEKVVSAPGVHPQRTRTIIDFTGLAVGAMKLETRNGRFNLLSYPFVDGFPAGRRESNSELANAAAYLRKTKFEKGGGVLDFDAAISKGEGAFRHDWEDAGRRDVHELTLTEVYVPLDVEAVAIGTFDAQRSGLKSEKGELRLLAGKPSEVRERLTGGASNTKAALIAAPAVTLLALLLVAPAWIVSLVPPLMNAQKQRIADALRDDDVPTIERIARAIDPNVPVDGDVVPLMLARSTGAARALLDAGADVNARRGQGQTVLMEIVPSGTPDLVELLIKAGANVNEVNPTWNATALSIARRENNAPVVEVLRAAGATEPVQSP